MIENASRQPQGDHERFFHYPRGEQPSLSDAQVFDLIAFAEGRPHALEPSHPENRQPANTHLGAIDSRFVGEPPKAPALIEPDPSSVQKVVAKFHRALGLVPLPPEEPISEAPIDLDWANGMRAGMKRKEEVRRLSRS